jgi:hypothetical protein
MCAAFAGRVLGTEQELQQPQPGRIAQLAGHDYLLRAM